MIRTILTSNRRKAYKALHSQVFLNGVEVTNDCQVADDRVGRVLLLKRDEGQAYFDEKTGGVAKEWRHGKVEIRRRPGKVTIRRTRS